ncbi:alpha/beta hydrolase [Algoriphagus halophilus]|uniref:Alpha/beta hydrolase fold n=1 Tax=Algoriphagus halophilus TaxID=226505 RepID=A0A1N6ELS8_9BACT|nr:alpha/beta hydrolase [Algoriphagus halophilus]SIN83996.1 alpha/beta hydrolase fold [Algoriphagus halophilus]
MNHLVTYRYFLVLVLLMLNSCAFKGVHRYKGLEYTNSDLDASIPRKSLNVFSPKKADSLPVMIFLYGGSWESGKKEIYDFLGSRMARREVVTVIADYPLSPDYQVEEMVKTAAQAVRWTKENIAKYGGSADQIFVSGHSAGAHLAAVLSTNNEYFEELGMDNPIKGGILIDPAGLDMHWFLSDYPSEGKKYFQTFTENPDVWKSYSPIYFLEGQKIPLLILEGERTYPSISESIDRFLEKAEEEEAEVSYEFYPHKKHIPMITQFFWTGSQGYDDVLGFIRKEASESRKATSLKP